MSAAPRGVAETLTLARQVQFDLPEEELWRQRRGTGPSVRVRGCTGGRRPNEVAEAIGADEGLNRGQDRRPRPGGGRRKADRAEGGVRLQMSFRTDLAGKPSSGHTDKAASSFKGIHATP